MREIVPPCCLILSLLLLIAAFAILSRERPQPTVELHRARVENDERYRDVLEADLERRLLQRKVLLVSLFGLAVVVGVAGFVAMRPAGGGHVS